MDTLSETASVVTASASAERRQAQKDLLFPCVATLYEEPLVMAEAHGVWVKDIDGDEYLDLFAGILTAPSLGSFAPRHSS